KGPSGRFHCGQRWSQATLRRKIRDTNKCQNSEANWQNDADYRTPKARFPKGCVGVAHDSEPAFSSGFRLVLGLISNAMSPTVAQADSLCYVQGSHESCVNSPRCSPHRDRLLSMRAKFRPKLDRHNNAQADLHYCCDHWMSCPPGGCYS